MKKCITWMLVLLLCVLCACGHADTPAPDEMIQPIRLYYCPADDESFDLQYGGLDWELYDLGEERLSSLEVLELYLAGPYSASLRSPFPKELRLNDVTLVDGLLVIDADEAVRSLNGIDRTLAAAALVQTMTQFSGIDAVQILCNGSELLNGWSRPMTVEQFLLEDDTATSDAATIKLYFSDHEGRYLLEETRNCSFESETEIPTYIVEQIIDGPLEADRRPTLPDGTRLLGIHLSNGVCTLNFSEDFVRNRPTTHKRARMAVYSIVSSLTELAEVESVRFLSGGNDLGDYAGLDLSVPIYRDESVFGTAKDQEDFVDLNVYLPSLTQSRLAAVPMTLHRTSGRALEADVVGALIGRTDLNHYYNPIPEGTMVIASEVRNGCCELVLNSAFVLCDNDPEQAQLAVRSIVATLCGLDGVNEVQLSIHNGKLSSVDLSEPMTVGGDWFLP